MMRRTGKSIPWRIKLRKTTKPSMTYETSRRLLRARRKAFEDALNVANAWGKNELEKLADLDYPGLITKVEQLEKNLLEGARHGFNNGVA